MPKRMTTDEHAQALRAAAAKRYESTWPQDGTRVPFWLSHIVSGGLPELGRNNKHGRPVRKTDY